MKVYSYNWATGEYIGEDEADPSPLEPGVFLMPVYSTTKAPPSMEELGSNQRAVYDREKDEWSVEDIPAQAATPETFQQQLDEIPTFDLLGDETIGDLFNA